MIGGTLLTLSIALSAGCLASPFLDPSSKLRRSDPHAIPLDISIDICTASIDRGLVLSTEVCSNTKNALRLRSAISFVFGASQEATRQCAASRSLAKTPRIYHSPSQKYRHPILRMHRRLSIGRHACIRRSSEPLAASSAYACTPPIMLPRRLPQHPGFPDRLRRAI